MHGDIPNVTADWEWKIITEITISALQRGAWKTKDGRIVTIFINVSDETIHFRIPDLRTGKMNNISLDGYNLKIIKEP